MGRDADRHAPLVAGQFAESLQFTLDGLDVPDLERIRVYILPAADECDPKNNETAWEGPFCAATTP